MVDFTSAPLPTRPVDMISGFDAGLADVERRKAQAQTLEQMMIQNSQKKAELERYQGMTPNELAESDWKGTMARNRTGNAQLQQAIMSGEIGDAQSKAVKGQLDTATLSGNINATNAANAGKVDQQRLDSMQRALDFMNVQEPMLKSAVQAGPMAAQMYWQQLHSALPDAVKQALPTTWSPDLMPKLDLMRQRMVQNVDAQRKVWEEQEKQKAAGAWHKDVAHITGGYHLQAAGIAAEAKKKDFIRDLQTGLTKYRAGQGWAVQAYAATKDDPSIPENLRRAIAEAAKADDAAILQAQRAKQQPTLPGFPQVPLGHNPYGPLGSGTNVPNPNDPLGIRR